MRTSISLAAMLSLTAMLASACTSEVAPEPTASASQRITACGFPEAEYAICDRSQALGSCTEFRADDTDLSEAEEVCAASDGAFQTNARCPRDESLLGVCPVQEQPGELRLHYYYAGQVFADATMPTMACSHLNDQGWCSAN